MKKLLMSFGRRSKAACKGDSYYSHRAYPFETYTTPPNPPDDKNFENVENVVKNVENYKIGLKIPDSTLKRCVLGLEITPIGVGNSLYY